MRGRADRRWWGTAIAAVLLWAPVARAVVLRGSEVVGAPGATVDVAVTLESGGASIAGTQNDIEIRPPLNLAADDRSCVVNPAIDKTGFFHVLPCETDGACVRLRALVLSLHSVDPIAGSELYHCRLVIDGDAPPGVYPVAITEAYASDPRGNPLVTAGVGGRVIVSDGSTATVRVDDTTAGADRGFPELPVRLVDGAGASTLTVDLVLSDAVYITSGVANEPRCEGVLPGISTAFAFQPPGCSRDGGTCTTMRATINASAALPSDAVLFQCALFPVPVLEPGDYVADCAATAAAPGGAPVPAVCLPGVLRLVDPYLNPSPAPTDATPTVGPAGVHGSPTPTARLGLGSPTPTPTFAIDVFGSGDTDGCQVAPPASGGLLLPLLGAGLFLARRSRRR